LSAQYLDHDFVDRGAIMLVTLWTSQPGNRVQKEYKYSCTCWTDKYSDFSQVQESRGKRIL